MSTQTETAPASTSAPEYERGLLSALLIAPGALEVAQAGGITGDSFADTRHSLLLEGLTAAREAGVPWEPVPLGRWLIDHHALLPQGLVWLAELYALGTAVASVPWYAEQLAGFQERRRLTVGSTRLAQLVQAGAPVDRIDAAARELLTRPDGNTLGMTSLGELSELGLAEIDLRTSGTLGMQLGFADIDAEIPGGLRGGNLVTVAGPTSGGKSTLVLDMARALTIRGDSVVGLFSLEMSGQELFDKILAAETGIELRDILTGRLTDGEWALAAKMAQRTSSAQLYSTSQRHSVADIRRRALGLRQRCGRLDALIIDHVGLVQMTGRTRENEVSEAMRQLKALSIELDIVIIVVAQYNRAGTAAVTVRPPELGDLKDSSEIEQSSTIVLMLHDPAKLPDGQQRAGEMDVWIRKNRFGRKDLPVVVIAQLHRSRFLGLEWTR